MKLLPLIVAALILGAVIGLSATASARPASATRVSANSCPPGQTSGDYCLQKSPGQYCKTAGASKKKAPGVKGKTPFALCVTAVAKVNKNNDIAPATACKALSKKKYPGMKRTPFAACTSAVKSAKNDLA